MFQPKPMYLVPMKVVLNFFQNHGQSLQERVDALNEAIELAGFNGVKAEVRGEGWTVNGPDKSADLFMQFYSDLKACFPKGKFEAEEEAVRDVISQYQTLASDNLR